jgi:hypothetical protein
MDSAATGNGIMDGFATPGPATGTRTRRQSAHATPLKTPTIPGDNDETIAQRLRSSSRQRGTSSTPCPPDTPSINARKRGVSANSKAGTVNTPKEIARGGVKRVRLDTDNLDPVMELQSTPRLGNRESGANTPANRRISPGNAATRTPANRQRTSQDLHSRTPLAKSPFGRWASQPRRPTIQQGPKKTSIVWKYISEERQCAKGWVFYLQNLVL